MSPRKIIHVDMDAFYASVEQRDNSSLRGRPVAVGHGAKRGVVAAASYEARAFGVRSAMPSTTAMQLCADLVFVPPRFDVYRAVSRQIHTIFADYTPLIEPLSLDEAYLDVTEDLRGLSTASATAKEIRARIFDHTCLTASAGISYNKFFAKLASTQRKPNGQFVITPEMGPDFIASLPVAKFHGVGPVTAAKMQRLGIQTGTDLRNKSLGFLQQHFGKSAAWYLAIANGIDDRPVVAESGAKVFWLRDHLRARPDRGRRNRGWRCGHGRRGLGMVREGERVWPDGNGEGKVRGLSDHHTQPQFSECDSATGGVTTGKRGAGAHGVPNDQGDKAARCYGFEFRSGHGREGATAVWCFPGLSGDFLPLQRRCAVPRCLGSGSNRMAGAGRKRNGCFSARNGNKQTPAVQVTNIFRSHCDRFGRSHRLHLGTAERPH